MSALLLSTVTPVYRGVGHLETLVGELEEVRRVLEARQAPIALAEAIFVDDGSTDGSDRVLAELAGRHSWVRVLTLSRNYGQHPATAAGILHSCGDWVATLDEDLQHRPHLLLSLLIHAVRSGSDIVYAKPEEAVHATLGRDLSSRLYKRLLAWVAGNAQVRSFNSFRMLRGSVARAASAVSRQETYFDVALQWFSSRAGVLVVPMRDGRSRGHSGYSWRSLLSHARRLLISSEIRPLRIGIVVGAATVALSFAAALGVVVLRLARPATINLPGWASLIVIMLFFGGLLSLLLGIALEYLSGLYQQELGRPTFFVVDRSSDALLVDLDPWPEGPALRK